MMAKSRRYLKKRREKVKCQAKVKYLTKFEAAIAASRLRKDKGRFTRIYRCPGLYGEARHWHVTTGGQW